MRSSGSSSVSAARHDGAPRALFPTSGGRLRLASEKRLGPHGPELAGLERAAVVLIALHSVVVGLLLLFATEWGARLGGFAAVTPLFFARQAGAFHLVVAAAYLLEYFRYRGVVLLLLTKVIAVAFLGCVTLLGDAPWVVPLSGLGDALMAAALLGVRRARGAGLAGPTAA
jgi:hypothetical protein